jgi:glutamate-1-semialdehyde 2,1-aminomutase
MTTETLPSKTARSEALFARARAVTPGGVNSPVRAFRSVGGTPRFIREAHGAYLTDADGTRLLDYIGSWGPMILGHDHPAVREAILEALAGGTSFGAPGEREVLLAETVTRITGAERVRFVNSGTEATMSALRLARGFTGRKYIVKFRGNYHGHADGLLVEAGSGLMTNAQRGHEVAAVIFEPVVGNAGVLIPTPEFLAALHRVRDFGALLIADEVMTGFRLSLNGATGRLGLSPDLTCWGKVIGGGLPVGAYGGRADVMDYVSPQGPVYQAGTLSGNPLAMAAGLATLGVLEADPGIYGRLEAYTSRLAEGLKAAAREAGVVISVNHVGSMLTAFHQDAPEGSVRTYTDAARSDTASFARWFQAMLARGVYWAPSQFESIFVGAAHTDAELDATLEAARAAYAGLGEGV